jgi:hypothetical protein
VISGNMEFLGKGDAAANGSGRQEFPVNLINEFI